MHTPAQSHSTTLAQVPLAVALVPPVHELPLCLSRVPAGFPSPATDYLADALDLNTYLVQHKAASFLFNVKGQSMQGAGIMDGDKVVVDRSIEARHGHIVIAVVDGEFTIKRLHMQGGRVELRPENPRFKPIPIQSETQLEVWGVVVGVVRRYT